MVNRHHAYRLLQCLTVAIRPLRVEELAEILALDFDNTKDGVPQVKEDWRWKDQQEAVLSTCSSLIAVVRVNFGFGRYGRVVQFSHFSVKEFLTSDRLAASRPEVSHFYVSPEPAHTVIVKACLGILLRSDDGMGNVKAKSSALDRYAAEHWVGHAQFENVLTHIEDGVRRLFDPARPYFDTWHNLYDLDKGWDTFSGYYYARPRGSPLYYASLCGLRNTVAHLVAKRPTHVNAKLGQSLSPLVAALHNRHFDIAELLYQHGAIVDVIGEKDRTPLYAALLDGFADIAEWLLTHGADAISPPDSHESKIPLPIAQAVTTGKFQCVQVLLRYRAGIFVKGKRDGRTMLHLATAAGHVNIVRLLLQHGADIYARDPNQNTSLHLALPLQSQVSDIVQLLALLMKENSAIVFPKPKPPLTKSSRHCLSTERKLMHRMTPTQHLCTWPYPHGQLKLCSYCSRTTPMSTYKITLGRHLCIWRRPCGVLILCRYCLSTAQMSMRKIGTTRRLYISRRA